MSCYRSPMLEPLFYTMVSLNVCKWFFLCSRDLLWFQYQTPQVSIVAVASLKSSICHMCAVFVYCVCYVEGAGQRLARFSLAGSSRPAMSNELCSTVLSLPLSREITLWTSSLPSPASLGTCAHSLINTLGSLRKSEGFTDSASVSLSLLFSPTGVIFRSSVSGFTLRQIQP